MPIGMTGAVASPRHKLAGLEPYRPGAAPANWGIVAPRYSMWGNDKYGDCVTAEEAANIANFTAALGISPHVLADSTVIEWARKHGVLNGAFITDVLDWLQQARKDGLIDQGISHMIGPYQPVDWENRAALTSAIFTAQGSVCIGIASVCLGEAVQGRNGWMVLSAKKSRALDHCVGLCGYGTLAFCCQLCGVPVPSDADPTMPCYLLYTWSCVGIVSQAALNAMCGEAWVRLPASIADPPYAPGPVPPPEPPAPSPCADLVPCITIIVRILELFLRRVQK